MLPNAQRFRSFPSLVAGRDNDLSFNTAPNVSFPFSLSMRSDAVVITPSFVTQIRQQQAHRAQLCFLSPHHAIGGVQHISPLSSVASPSSKRRRGRPIKRSLLLSDADPIGSPLAMALASNTKPLSDNLREALIHLELRLCSMSTSPTTQVASREALMALVKRHARASQLDAEANKKELDVIRDQLIESLMQARGRRGRKPRRLIEMVLTMWPLLEATAAKAAAENVDLEVALKHVVNVPQRYAMVANGFSSSSPSSPFRDDGESDLPYDETDHTAFLAMPEQTAYLPSDSVADEPLKVVNYLRNEPMQSLDAMMAASIDEMLGDLFNFDSMDSFESQGMADMASMSTPSSLDSEDGDTHASFEDYVSQLWSGEAVSLFDMVHPAMTTVEF
jgi:hypothetical protein